MILQIKQAIAYKKQPLNNVIRFTAKQPPCKHFHHVKPRHHGRKTPFNNVPHAPEQEVGSRALVARVISVHVAGATAAEAAEQAHDEAEGDDEHHRRQDQIQVVPGDINKRGGSMLAAARVR